MRKTVLILMMILMLFVFLCACRYQNTISLDTTAKGQQTTVLVSENETTQTVETMPSEVQSIFPSVEYTENSDREVTDLSVAESTALAETTNAKSEEKTDEVPTEVDISVDMPSANGKMMLNTDENNRYIQIVYTSRNIPAELLWAVYSEPDNGQNYVFEFNTAKSKTVDDLRRVYLIDKNGEITGVSAVKASEKEGIGSVENWFCMNVLIKQIIFPEISKQFVA